MIRRKAREKKRNWKINNIICTHNINTQIKKRETSTHKDVKIIVKIIKKKPRELLLGTMG